MNGDVPANEVLEGQLLVIIDEAQKNGLPVDEILSILELRIYALKEEVEG